MMFRTRAPILLSVLFLFACEKAQHSNLANRDLNPQVIKPTLSAPVVFAGSIPEGSGKIITLSNGMDVYVQKRGESRLVFQVEATFTPEAFDSILSVVRNKPEQEKIAHLSRELRKIQKKLKGIQALSVYEAPQVGYFIFEMVYNPAHAADILAPLSQLKVEHSLRMEPVAYGTSILSPLRDENPLAEGAISSGNSSENNTAYSGLDRIHVPEFLKKAEEDIGGGVKVNGSSVHVGVADTGMTLNHPSFLSQDGTRNRIYYMRDFTKEGRVYFNRNAKFEVTVPTDGGPDDLMVNAEMIYTPKLPNVPVGDLMSEVKGLRIKVTPELKAILTKPGSGAKLGILDEEVLQSEEDAVDLSGDGSLDTKIWLILVPGPTPDKDVVYVDPSGTGDFRAAIAVGDWNATKMTVPTFAEKIGFDLRDDVLPSLSGLSQVPVRSASLVGFDPGNHGTHVSGIIAGRRTIQNDDPNTLARGVAPEAMIGMNRVCANNGGCSAASAVIDLAMNAKSEVINLSLGGLTQFNDGYSLQEILINRLTELYNVLFVISAGNSGPGRQTVGSPSTAKSALSVGATATRKMIQKQYQWPGNGTSNSTGNTPEDDDFILFFSSRGPTAAGGFKPNITAPGTELSSIQLNSAPGHRGGMDVYWGTSMAAPAATGAYALFLDAIKKYNLRNPDKQLTTDATTLREVLIHSARPFDVSRFDPATSEKLNGQYTWLDQGMGMLDLTAAWKLVFELRDHPLPSSVNYKNAPVELEYEVLIPLVSPSGVSYDGSRAATPGVPAFGSGVYLSYDDSDTTRQVSLTRKLPSQLIAVPEVGELMTQLRTTQDQFVLKTYIYGSDKQWIKAGTLDQIDCTSSDSNPLTINGEGAKVQVARDGTGKLNPSPMSSLNLCINREMVRKDLEPGDHGAIVFGYRKVGQKIAVLPSFTVPVSLTVPHHTLASSTAYDVQQSVNGFGVKRNYVIIPKGATLVRVTLEVPELKKSDPALLASEKNPECSGVELMPLIGSNISKPFKSRLDARIFNCDSMGRFGVPGVKPKLTFTVPNPKPGVWDLPVLGSYKFVKSQYHLRVDYLVATPSVTQINGGIPVLTGSLQLAMKESSMSLVPHIGQSSYDLQGLQTVALSQVPHHSSAYVAGPQGVLRMYPPQVQKVVFATAGSPGNDIDLAVMECPPTALSPIDSGCTEVARSDGPTDEEMVSFSPKEDARYAVRVDGAEVKNEGRFTLFESLLFHPEKGTLSIGGSGSLFDIQYSMTENQFLSSVIGSSELYRSGKYAVMGYLTIRSEDQTTLSVIPIHISNNVPKPQPSPTSSPSP